MGDMVERYLLILPFDARTYPDPTPILSTIYRTLSSLPNSATHFVVCFATPPEYDNQLYNDLLDCPLPSWDPVQTFLGKVYACLAAAQWTTDRILLDVEVAFAAESHEYKDDTKVIVLEGYEDLAQTVKVIGTPSTVHCPALPDTNGPLEVYPPEPGPPVVALGGTFDHLHAAHKLLLHLALFIASRKLIVGVMADRMLSSKTNAPLLQPLSSRLTAIREFLARHGVHEAGYQGRGRQMEVVEIADGYGPTAYDPDIQALVVSQETLSGGEAVNKLRSEKGLSRLDLFVIDVIASTLDVPDLPPGAVKIVPDEADEQDEAKGKIHVQVADEVRTLDLSGERDERKLKELKMGSTAIRQWIADHQKDG